MVMALKKSTSAFLAPNMVRFKRWITSLVVQGPVYGLIPLNTLEGEAKVTGFVFFALWAVKKSLLSIAVDFGIPIIPTRSPEDTAAMINRIAIREQTHERSDIQIRTEKKPLTTWEQQIFIVESLPNIGPVTARKLLEEFKTVRGVINASEEELKKVDGIGDKIAKNIIRVVDSGFKTLKSEKYLKLDLKNS